MSKNPYQAKYLRRILKRGGKVVCWTLPNAEVVNQLTAYKRFLINSMTVAEPCETIDEFYENRPALRETN